MTADVLVAENLVAGYDATDIVRGVSCAMPAASIVAIIGPNGSGKSTFIKTLAGVLRARAGTIRLAGEDVTALDAPARARRGLAYVPQEGNVFRNMSVDENLALSIEFLERSQDQARRSATRARVFELFPDIAKRPAALAGNLSGGQRQMLAIACALLAEPKVLLLDEPSAGLSPTFVDEMFATTRNVNATGVAVLVIEQNVAAALSVAGHALVLAGGQVRLSAPAREIAGGDLHELYLGGAA